MMRAENSRQTEASRKILHNGFLWVGGALVIMAMLLALTGPWIAPQDPLQENYIGQSGDRFYRPPFSPGRVEGFPLGSDEFGRDLFSRLLWGIRPTLLLVIVVAALRLSIGVIVGLTAGWITGRVAAMLDALVSACLSIPVLLVALTVVAVLAKKWDVWAFILGLSITGWVDSGRMVQTLTRSLKAQPFIEASRSMGANDGQILLGHVLAHVLPVVLIQFAFEISAALLTVAALGFLGYFINAVYIPIGDFYGIRASRAPELAQMLGTSLRYMPWMSASAGTLIFVMILAFNFLGVGLRIEMSPEQVRRNRAKKASFEPDNSWLEERAYLMVSEWRRSAVTLGAFGALLLVVVGGGWLLWSMQSRLIPATAIQVPGEHPWAAERRDAQGSYWSPARGPRQAMILWRYFNPDGFVGGPVIDVNGSLYLTARGKTLVSLTPEGKERWRVTLPAEPLGSPAINKDGRILVATEEGDLLSFDNSGKRLWVYRSDPPDQGLTSPVVGKARDGLIYYAVRNFLVAVTPMGKRAWQITLPTYSYVAPIPKVSPNGTYLFFEDSIVDAATGQRVRMEQTNPYDRYVAGADGLMYLYDDTGFKNWQPSPQGDSLVQTTKMDFRTLNLSFRFAVDAGVAPSRDVWMLFGYGREYPRLVWSSPSGVSPEVLDFPYRPWRLIGFDARGSVYACGMISTPAAEEDSQTAEDAQKKNGPECRAVQPEGGSVLWRLPLDEGRVPVGGAIVERRVYVTMQEGIMFAIGE